MRRTTMHQVMDWRAAVWAGLIAGAVTLLAQMILVPLLTGGTVWAVFHHIAAIVLGPETVVPSLAFEPLVVVVGTAVHLALALFYTLILAFIIHRWGLLVGIVGGALFGLALYLVNYYTFTVFFPWFYPLRSWLVIAVHVLFGAVAGGAYEALEREMYVPVSS